MNEQQKRAADAWLINPNKTAAALQAGYKPNYAKKRANEIFEREDVKKYIAERLEEIDSKKIADTKELLQYLTSVVRGESKAMTVVVADGCIRRVHKNPDEKERLKATDMLLKRIDIISGDTEDLTPLAEMLK